MTSFVTGVVGFYIEKYKKKFVWICTDNESPKKWVFLNSQIEINRRQKVNIIKSLIFLFNAFVYDFSRHWGMLRVTHAFTQNEIQKKLLKKEFNLDSFLMISGHEIPQNIRPIEERLVDRIILWVSNLGQKKRPEKFIELARIADASKFRFIIIGSRDDEAYIKRLFKDRPENLTWLGRLPFGEALGWFDKAAIFINTSNDEGFPNTFIQAWLRGVPVITLGVDPDGIIEKHKLGYVARDIKGILNYIIYLINDKVAYTEFSRNASRYAQRYHSITAMTDKFLNILDISDK
jgi:glycosyltransferase involved in cell wall biosynthesis